MNIVEEVRKIVKKECRKETNFFGISAYDDHFISTVKYANN